MRDAVIVLTAMMLAVMPYVVAIEVVGDDMNYILSHVSKEEYEAARSLWERTISQNLAEGTEISQTLGIVVQPSMSEWSIARDPQNQSVYRIRLEGLPKKPYTEPKASAAITPQLSPEELESREASEIAEQAWKNRANDYDNITFDVNSTGSRWVLVPVLYKHQLYKYGKLNAQGRAEVMTGTSEEVSISQLIAEGVAEGRNVDRLIALQKQVEAAKANYEAGYKQEAKTGNKPEAVVASDVKGNQAAGEKSGADQAREQQEQKFPQPVTEVTNAKEEKPLEQVAEAPKSDETNKPQQESKPEAAKPGSDAPKKKRVSFIERILNWFR